MYHKMRNISFLLSLTLVSSLVFSQNDQASFFSDSTHYIWPTNATKYLSSTFGETRSAHLHSGIDIRTWGQEGYKVFASKDGTVHRIGIGPHGYGNVIYLKHNDGTYTVYAHLNRFEENLQAYADSIRLQNYKFELNHFPDENSITYQQGDVIGYTGSTGVGPPHLHFEVRDRDFNPLNPLLTNLADEVDDTLPPVFTQLGVEFLDSKSYRFEGFEIYTAEGTNGIYEFGEISVSGPIGLSVNVHDKANRAPNSYAVHSLMMVHERDTLFHSVKDQFEFHQSNDMFLDRSYPILSETRRGFQRLFRVAGNRLPIYKNLKNEGVLNLNDGSYSIKIIAEDIYGNRSTASVVLNIERTGRAQDVYHVATYPLPKAVAGNTSQRWISSTVIPEESLFASTGPELAGPVHREEQFYFTSATTTESKLLPGKLDVLHTPDQKLWIQFPNESLYDTLTISMELRETLQQVDIEFSPVKLPLNQSAHFNYILPVNFRHKENLALFSVDPFRNRERFISANISNGMVRARLNEVTNLRIKEDNIAPWVGRPRIDKNLGGMDIVKIPVKDENTGIDYRRSNIIVNGERGIVEYDPEKNFLVYYHPGFNPLPANTVTYEVFDGVGNRRAAEIEIRYD